MEVREPVALDFDSWKESLKPSYLRGFSCHHRSRDLLERNILGKGACGTLNVFDAQYNLGILSLQ
jgi:hypothetical protein